MPIITTSTSAVSAWTPLTQFAYGFAIYPFTPEQGAWYRGYVVSKSCQTGEPQVFVGIFPKNHVYIKEYLDDVKLQVNESTKSFNDAASLDSTTRNENEKPASINDNDDNDRPPPPLPSLECGDDTISGKNEPLIDEISSAVREWCSLLPTYLEERRYSMFRTVKDQINDLLQGRRQLLAQTLSQDELSKLRKELINKLVSGNIIQDLDIIVRHPEKGFLADETNVSAIRLYQLQGHLSILNAEKLKHDSSLPFNSPTILNSPSITSPSLPAILLQNNSSSYTTIPTIATNDSVSHAPKFYHVFLDLKAWVASISAFGEYTELYFSLYTKTDSRFITEEYCIILNHNGVPKDESKIQKIRTLFTDLSPHDIQDQVFLICRIIRTGSMKMENKDKDFSKDSNSVKSSSSSFSSQNNSNGNNSTNIRLSPQTFRRPFGCAILDITHLIQGKEKESMSEHVMQIYVPTQGSTFAILHEDIIYNRVKEFEKSPRAEMISVSIRSFYGEATTIIKENTALLQDITITSRLGFADVVFPGDVRNEIYLKLWSGDFTQGRTTTARNIQVTAEVRLSSGEVLKNAISQGSGEPPVTQFESIVFYHSNNPTWGEFIKLTIPSALFEQAHVFLTFKHRTTKDKKEDKFFAFGYLPLFPEKRAFISDGKHTLTLYKYDKQLINPPSYLSVPWSSLATIVDTASVHLTNNSQMSLHKLISPLKDTAVIWTYLCSTKYTQNEVLLKLLNWEKQLLSNENELKSVLKKFTFVSEVEIVKFLQDIFDALFGILVSARNQQGELDDLIFNALVTILGIVSDRRFMNFKPVLDVYIENHFSCAAASSHFIRSMNHLVSNPTGVETAKNLRSAIKVWQYIFKFIMRSRELQRTKETDMGLSGNYVEEQFKTDLFSLFKSIDKLMSITTPQSIIGTQALALQHFGSIFTDLGKCFSSDDLILIAIRFTESVRLPKGKLLAYKLLVILQFCRGPLFENPESRATLIPRVVEWLSDHMGRWEVTNKQTNDYEAARLQWQDGIRLCVSILAVMLEILQNSIEKASNDKESTKREIENVMVLLPLLMKLCESYRELHITSFDEHESLHHEQNPLSSSNLTNNSGTPSTINSYRYSKDFPFFQSSNKMSSGLGEIATVLLQIIYLVSQKNMKEHLLSTYYREGHDSTAEFLIILFQVARSVLINDAFPKSWLNMNMIAHKTFLKVLEPISIMMEKNYIPDKEAPNSFNEELWREYFNCLLCLLTSRHLVIEDFTPQKRRAIWRLAGDIRGQGAKLLSTLWNAIGWEQGKEGKMGGYQVRFINTLLGPMLELCLSHHDELRSAATTVLFSMIVTQYMLEKDLKQIESDIIDIFDRLFMSETKGDEMSCSYFIAQLKGLFEESLVDMDLRDAMIKFLDSLNEFLELLLGVRELPEGEEFQDDRIMCTLKLMKFIKTIERNQIYIKYVHQLVQMQINSHNFVEAALTLKLHSDLYNWDPNIEVEALPELNFPKQSAFDRKERLYIQILGYFVKGKAWEYGIEICKELAKQFECTTFEYQRLSNILKQQAVLHENIIMKERYFSEYFRVGFYGRGFPASLQNRQFIYRGFEWEKIGAFCERMQNKHTQAQLLKSNSPPTDDILHGDGQFLQVTAVKPEPNKDLPVFKGDVPSSIRSYYEYNSVDTFSFSRPVNKNPNGIKSGNEFLDLWTEKTILVSKDHFPTVLRRSEVIKMTVFEVSPIENAVTTMRSKNKELLILESKYRALLNSNNVGTAKVNTNPLTMSLNGAVDAPVNGGVPMYKKAFFDPEFISTNPDKESLVRDLKESIDEQVEIIYRCLQIHDCLVSHDMRPLHETLFKFFHKNFAEEIKRLTERRKAKEGEKSKQITTNDHQVISTIVSSQTSPFFLPPLNVNNPNRIPSFYAISQLNGEQISPTSPIGTSPIGPSSSSSIITRVAAAKANFNSSRFSPMQSDSPNGLTLSDALMIEKRKVTPERKKSLISAERRMTLRGWSFNRNRSSTN
ncbi:2984_t:CDS:2 [Entrophospora sp. SA101]|nr:943_t:CDS:2 [Entrophospora sp. SA101]CAJ0894063.1 2984_t:CDS:2 [Entrophospora sp. SA101]